MRPLPPCGPKGVLDSMENWRSWTEQQTCKKGPNTPEIQQVCVARGMPSDIMKRSSNGKFSRSTTGAIRLGGILITTKTKPPQPHCQYAAVVCKYAPSEFQHILGDNNMDMVGGVEQSVHTTNC